METFIYKSNNSLNAAILHNGNTLPSIPVRHAIHIKETYEEMKQLLKFIKYEQRQSTNLRCDLKVVALVLGLQGGYTFL